MEGWTGVERARGEFVSELEGGSESVWEGRAEREREGGRDG